MSPMDPTPPARHLASLLGRQRPQVLVEALAALARLHTTRYRQGDTADNAARLGALLDAVIESLEEGDPGPAHDHLTRVAWQRFSDGYPLGDVLSAFNALALSLRHRALHLGSRRQAVAERAVLARVLEQAKQALLACYVARMAAGAQAHRLRSQCGQ